MGGEKAATFRAVCGPKGSPPRGRGKACGRAAPRAQKGDHPRVGGEKVCAGLGMRKTMGSPPRWRGKDEIDIVVQVPSGITPALAGKSGSLCPQDRSRGDHPRVGGEKQRMPVRTDKRMGSPPRWRGKAIMPGTWSSSYGITPALAGKSAGERQRPPCPQDHPRVGGEKQSTYQQRPSSLGSPPRWRGKAFSLSIGIDTVWITPALAGKRPRGAVR